jgi:hypothetical protein
LAFLLLRGNVALIGYAGDPAAGLKEIDLTTKKMQNLPTPPDVECYAANDLTRLVLAAGPNGRIKSYEWNGAGLSLVHTVQVPWAYADSEIARIIPVSGTNLVIYDVPQYLVILIARLSSERHSTRCVDMETGATVVLNDDANGVSRRPIAWMSGSDVQHIMSVGRVSGPYLKPANRFSTEQLR